MRIYRRLSNIKAISFDLDDTLYSNREIMRGCEQAMLAFFAKHIGTDRAYDFAFWFEYRKQVIAQQPAMKHDVTELRRASYRLGMLSLGLSEQEATKLAGLALAEFMYHRSQFKVPEASHQLLAELSAKLPVIAISNGNVDVQVIGIADYFTAIYHANLEQRQKPASDMFDLACGQLNINHTELLHVGDCGRADIKGARRAGCQSAWLSVYDVGRPITSLPDIRLDNLAELKLLVGAN